MPLTAHRIRNVKLGFWLDMIWTRFLSKSPPSVLAQGQHLYELAEIVHAAQDLASPAPSPKPYRPYRCSLGPPAMLRANFPPTKVGSSRATVVPL